MSNVVQIKRGFGRPGNGALYPYELAYSVTEGEEGGYLYIGGLSDNQENPALETKGIKVESADRLRKISLGSDTLPIFFYEGVPCQCGPWLDVSATKLQFSRSLITKLNSTTSADFDGSANVNIGVSGVLPVANGGTGRSSLTDGYALIGKGTDAIDFRSIKNNTEDGHCGWTGNSDNSLITLNTLAYWNGAYSGTNSNLAYCKKGEFGTIVTKNEGDYLYSSGGTITGNLTINNALTVKGALTIDSTLTVNSDSTVADGKKFKCSYICLQNGWGYGDKTPAEAGWNSSNSSEGQIYFEVV